jgi:hypothetical protein
LLQQLEHELERCRPIASGLHENVDYFSFVINITPQIVNLAVEPDENLAQMLPPAIRAKRPFTISTI